MLKCLNQNILNEGIVNVYIVEFLETHTRSENCKFKYFFRVPRILLDRYKVV